MGGCRGRGKGIWGSEEGGGRTRAQGTLIVFIQLHRHMACDPNTDTYHTNKWDIGCYPTGWEQASLSRTCPSNSLRHTFI